LKHSVLHASWYRPLALVAALLSATFGLWLLLAGVYLWSDDPARPTMRIDAQSLQLTAGEGAQSDQGLRVERAAPNGLVLVQGAIRPFEARDYRGLGWRLDGLDATRALRVIWATAATTRKPFDRLISTAERRAGFVDLTEDPNWEGLIVGVGLAVVGSEPESEPLLFESLTLQPRRPALSAILPLAWNDWRRDLGWTGRSINFTDSAEGTGRIRPLIPVVVWCALAALIHLLLAPPWRGFRTWTPYGVILLVGWLVLDARWQWLLLERLDQTRALYAGLDAVERRRVGPDQGFYPFIADIRDRLGTEPARLLLVASDPAGYGANRARYHLLPHNVRLTATLDAASGVTPGDFVLLMSPLDRTAHDRARSELVFGDWRLAVSSELSRPGLGTLFRVAPVAVED
jgi:hypothetical protein